MFVKSFASIYFSGDEIFVVELDPSRKRLKKAISHSLSAGVISNNKVSDKKKLTEALKLIWSTNGFKSRDVGLVIPEFSTFTKLISLPKLALGEIGEAVSWQAQEYLPTGTSDMVLDWKVLTRSETATEVLMVAVQKGILLDFVDACVSADLFPVAVETPSISLGNIINSEEGYVAVVAERRDLLVVAGEKNKILSTSVTSTADAKDITQMISRLLGHFNKVNFKNIYVGGAALDSTIPGNLKNVLKIGVSLLDPQIAGLDTASGQKYLIPISMSKKPAAEPSDPSTLNLLPINLVDKYQKQKARTQIWSLTLTATVFVWVSLLVVLGSFMVLTQQISSLKSLSQKTSQIASERKKVETEATQINKIVEDILKVKKASVFPELLLNNIFAAKPSGVTISDYDFDLDKGILSLRGISQDRQSLVEFKENLEKYEDFRSVDIPISSFEEVTDLTYSLNFVYEPANKDYEAGPKKR